MDKIGSLLAALIGGAGFDDPKSLKRFIVATLGVGAVALHDKFGISLTEIQLEAIAAITVSFILGSNYLSAAKKKGEEEAAKIVELTDAESVLSKTGKGGGTLLVLLCAGLIAFSSATAFAQDGTDPAKQEQFKADDAPVVDRSAEQKVLIEGQAAPFNGILLSKDLYLDVAKRITKCETTLGEVEPRVGLPVWQVVLITAGAVLVSASVAVPVTLAATGNLGPPK